MSEPAIARSSARQLLRADMVAMIEPRSAKPGLRWWLEVAARFIVVPRVRTIALFRLSQAIMRAGLAPLALYLQGRALRGSGAEISPSARIGGGLSLMHSVGVVIGPDVVVGRGARIYQGVTLGDGYVPGQPRIGDDVTLGAGSCVLGGVVVGDRVIVGAGARVTRDIPDDSLALGPDGSPRPRRPGADPRLDALAGWRGPRLDT